MPLRTRLRRAFTRSSQDDSSSLSKSSTKDSKRKDSNVYQPGEKMPPLKYRRPVDKKHKEHLEAFSFAKAWRRKSDQSIYSPMGSRMPSRKNSIVSVRRRSMGTRKGSSRGNDGGVGVDSGVGSSIGDRDMSLGGEANIKEGSDEEGDVANVGLSRQPTRDSQNPTHRLSTGRRSQSITSGGSQSAAAGRRSGSSKQDQPFTAADLELALRKSHLESPKQHLDTPHEVSSHESPGSPSEPNPVTQASA